MKLPDVNLKVYKKNLLIYLFNYDSSWPTFTMFNMVFDVFLSTAFVK